MHPQGQAFSVQTVESIADLTGDRTKVRPVQSAMLLPELNSARLGKEYNAMLVIGTAGDPLHCRAIISAPAVSKFHVPQTYVARMTAAFQKA